MKTNKGFTLIELLVVIAIIGILSSVVLASLNTARDKGANAAAKANLANARAQAELYYDGNGNSYTDVCTASGGIAANVDGASDAVTATAACAALTDGTAWAAEIELNDSEGFFCVDSAGAATTTGATSNISTSDADCDGS
jgi:prepilin-type N-terminal cleavage/methylation domain-containing protein